jgi:hypothetical protein
LKDHTSGVETIRIPASVKVNIWTRGYHVFILWTTRDLRSKLYQKTSADTSTKIIQVEEAKILWTQGHHEIAVNLLKYVISNCNAREDLASIHCLAGKWLANTHSDRFLRLIYRRVII